MSKRTLAIFAAFIATTIYGMNHTIAKGVMPDYIQPYGFILLRVVVASLLFWLMGLCIPREKIIRTDWWRLIAAAFFGMSLNMLTFFKGLSLTTPINSSVIMTTTPILVLLLSVLFIKEKINKLKVLGVGIGIIGALTLILHGAVQPENNTSIFLGNSLVFVNAISYGIYLIIVRPLTFKYHPFTLLKWLFLLSVFMNLPFSLSEFTAVAWENLPYHVIVSIGFVVLGTTFSNYLLNIYALKQLSASSLSVFMYVQPFIATVYAIAVGSDTLNFIKVIAAFLVFLGVYLVSRKTPVTS